ncbi:hypothetical protein CRUP_001167 [Coryphaenoides rupestris]|nr:hypothetical protein CRUP_001167 [Coryphaenoides rupestris]
MRQREADEEEEGDEEETGGDGRRDITSYTISVGRNLYCCWRICASFFLASSSSLSFRNISSWAAMI